MAMTEDRVSRGRLLKRAGVGAAVLGAGSMVTAATASANASPSLSCISVSGCGICATQGLGCEGNECCGCAITTEGCCFCIANVSCVGLPSCATSSKQCPPGWACAYTCCNGGATPVCVPHCGYTGPHLIPCIDGRVSAKAQKTPRTLKI